MMLELFFFFPPLTTHILLLEVKCNLQNTEHILEKSISLQEFNSLPNCTFYFDFTALAKSASTTEWLLPTTSLNSIYVHVLLLKNMEWGQRSQFKDNFQVSVG